MSLAWLPRRHGKQHAIPSYLPSSHSTCNTQRTVAKDTTTMNMLLSFWGPVPPLLMSLRYDTQKQTLQLKLTWALPSMLAAPCTQLATHLFVQPSTAFAAFAMWESGWLTACLGAKPFWAEPLPANHCPLPSCTWLFSSWPGSAFAPAELHPRLPNSILSTCHTLSILSDHQKTTHFTMLHRTYLKNCPKLENPARLLKESAETL